MSNYQLVELPLTDSQIYKLGYAIQNHLPVNLKISTIKQGQSIPLLLTQRQINSIQKKSATRNGFMLKLSSTQISKMKKQGGFLPAIIAALPTIGSFLLNTALPALASGALSGAAGLAVNEIGKKIRGEGLYPIGYYQ